LSLRIDPCATLPLVESAGSYGLKYLPIIEEEFALLVDRKAWFQAPLQKVVAFLGTKQFANRAKAYGGYEVEELGEVI